MERQSLYIFSFSRFVLKAFVVLFITGLAFDLLLEKFVIFKSEISGAYKIERILHEKHGNEIPIFGSSRAEGNIIPSMLDDDCFNYGISGAQANIWLFLLEKELAKNKSTPIVINFDLRGLTYSDGDVANYIPNWNSTKSILKRKGRNVLQFTFFQIFWTI